LSREPNRRGHASGSAAAEASAADAARLAPAQVPESLSSPQTSTSPGNEDASISATAAREGSEGTAPTAPAASAPAAAAARATRAETERAIRRLSSRLRRRDVPVLREERGDGGSERVPGGGGVL
jgi:hypothetical protein